MVDKKKKVKEHYAFLPASMILHAKYRKLSAHAKVLYTYLILTRAGADEWFNCPYETIRRDTGLYNPMITKGIRQLIEGEFIKCTHGGMKRNYNRYYLEPTWLTRDRQTRK